jgi:hypothetical protein
VVRATVHPRSLGIRTWFVGEPRRMMSPMTTAAAVLDAPLQAADGAGTTLRAQLGGGPLVVAFLRHFG